MDATSVSGGRVRTVQPVIGLAAAVSIALALTGCDSPGQQPAFVASAPGPTHAAMTNNTEYRIAPQDVLDISVYQVASLNRTVQVDANGRIDLPLIGSVRAGGQTARDLEAEIAKRMGAKYVQSPQVTVAVKEGLAMRFTVDGAVMKPGVYLAKGETTLTQAIAEAGGLGDVGDIDAVSISRVVDGQRVAAVHSLKAIRAGQEQDPPVYGKDTVTVAESGTLNTLKFVKELGGTAVGAARLVP